MAGNAASDRNLFTALTLPSLSKPTPPSTWTDLETSHLIDAYEEKWNSSKRGPLKAQQWEQISVEISARCCLPRPSKSGTQCRHKVEKLRKRYRSERLRPVRSLWPFFDRMDRMERGPASSSSWDDLKVDEEENGEGGGGMSGLAAELRRFGEGYVRLERRRMEMMKEKEKEWMEMESRRLEMLMEAQRGLVETIAGAFWKKKKKNSEDL